MRFVKSHGAANDLASLEFVQDFTCFGEWTCRQWQRTQLACRREHQDLAQLADRVVVSGRRDVPVVEPCLGLRKQIRHVLEPRGLLSRTGVVHEVRALRRVRGEVVEVLRLDPLRRHDLQATFLHRIRRRARS